VNNLRAVVASAIAVSIVTARKHGEHPTPRDAAEKRPLIDEHTSRVLRQLGIPADQNPSKWQDVDAELAVRGGWGPGASLTRLKYVASCFNCSFASTEPHIEPFDTPGKRKAYILTHAEKHPDHVISRWEQPT
jgi:hypothetical protein